MRITRTLLPPADPGRPGAGLEVFVAECDCGFSAISLYEHDACSIVDRHQRQCPKAHAEEQPAPKIKIGA